MMDDSELKAYGEGFDAGDARRQPACRATVDILSAERDALRAENEALRDVAAACGTLSGKSVV